MTTLMCLRGKSFICAALTVLSVGLLAAVSNQSALARAVASAPQVRTEDCGDGVGVINYTPGPGFNALTASDADLVRNGFPPRPTDNTMLPAWQSFVGKNRLPASSCAALAAANPHGSQRRITHTGYTSHNWGGIVDHNHAYTFAQSYWKLPSASASGVAYGATWVGIGLGNSTRYPLMQAGSESNNSGSSQTFDVWWEVYPQINSRAVPNGTNARAGDTMYAAVTSGTNSAKMQIYDESKGIGGTYTYRTGTFSGDGHAEWILERYNVSGWVYHLPHGSPTFTSALASAPGVPNTGMGTLPHYYFDMYTCNNSTRLAHPLAATNSGFTETVQWQAYGDYCHTS